MASESSLRVHLLAPEQAPLARSLSQHLGLPAPEINPPPMDQLSLIVDAAGPGLMLGAVAKKPLRVDFADARLAHRLRQGANREALNKALGLTKNPDQRIIDATAGLGRDGFLMAAIGAQLTALEHNPVLYQLLSHALQNAQQDDILATVVSRIDLHHANAVDWLTNQPGDSAEAVYLDPMFPERDKSAQVKKDMQILHALLGAADEETNAQLLAPALHVAGKRVVVKRPRLAPYLADEKPDHQLTGKSSRFDVYLCA